MTASALLDQVRTRVASICGAHNAGYPNDVVFEKECKAVAIALANGCCVTYVHRPETRTKFAILITRPQDASC